jgi:2-dehydropantoate 2-reductase
MRHAILGAGGVGGLIGAVLARAGHDVTLVVRPGTEEGYPDVLSLESPFGSVRARVRAVAELEQPADVLWIAVKATQLPSALPQIPETVEVGAIVPLLNGIDHIALLRDRFGNEKVIPATIAVESERVAPGQIVHRSPFARLRVSARGRTILTESIETLRSFGFDCAFVDDEVTLLWSKLVFLAPVALSTTAARTAIGDVLADEERREKLKACVREACAIAVASGAHVDAEAVIANIEALPKGTRSSMQKDQASGRALELDAIAGPILRGGERFSIPVPVTAELARACAPAITHTVTQ